MRIAVIDCRGFAGGLAISISIALGTIAAAQTPDVWIPAAPSNVLDVPERLNSSIADPAALATPSLRTTTADRPSESVDPIVRQAEQLVKNGQKNEAATLLHDYLDICPTDYKAAMALGQVYLELECWQAAINTLSNLK